MYDPLLRLRTIASQRFLVVGVGKLDPINAGSFQFPKLSLNCLRATGVRPDPRAKASETRLRFRYSTTESPST